MKSNDKSPKPIKKPVKKSPPVKKLANKSREKLIKDPKGEMEVMASKLALEMAARLELSQTNELSSLEIEVATALGEGFQKKEVIDIFSISSNMIDMWMKKPTFLRKLNEVTTQQGTSDKNVRIRLAKRRLELLNEAYFAKQEDIKELGITTISKLIVDANKEVADLMDENKVVDTKTDVSIMIVNYFKDKKGKEYSDIDDFLNDPQFKFPTIDAEVIND